MNKADLLPPFVAGIFSGNGSATDLVGSRCPQCGALHFPGVDICPDDFVETVQASLGNRGTLYSYTVVRTKPPFDLPAPYAVGYVDLEDAGLRVFMLLDPARIDDYRIDMPLSLMSGPVGVGLNKLPCRRPYFTPDIVEG